MLGVPVIGVASNLDQFLNMQAIERAGAGLTLRADHYSKDRLVGAVDRLLKENNIPVGRGPGRALVQTAFVDGGHANVPQRGGGNRLNLTDVKLVDAYEAGRSEGGGH